MGVQKKVKTIPATLTRFTASPITEQKKRKVAGYARVSTDHDDQFSSYEAQIDYYTNYIKGRDDWAFVEVYTDEGITGTSTKHREGFKQMIADALDGKIDLIVTKSVSRFARNTVDSLTTIRQLKEAGVEVYFEKENIWTFDGKGELLLTIMSSLAQEESRSISENCTWGQRKRFADGKVSVPFQRFLRMTIKEGVLQLTAFHHRDVVDPLPEDLTIKFGSAHDLRGNLHKLRFSDSLDAAVRFGTAGAAPVGNLARFAQFARLGLSPAGTAAASADHSGREGREPAAGGHVPAHPFALAVFLLVSPTVLFRGGLPSLNLGSAIVKMEFKLAVWIDHDVVDLLQKYIFIKFC